MSSPPKGSGSYYDGYMQQATFILDEMNGNCMTPQTFNRLVDRYPVDIPVHGGSVPFNSPYIIITSNYHPKYWWKNRAPHEVEQTLRRLHLTIKFLKTSPPVHYQNQHGEYALVPFADLFQVSKKMKN